MSDIESIGEPLVYKAAVGGGLLVALTTADDSISIRTSVRAMGGMLKEALVNSSSTQTTWRMVSDEGPQLNGTDLAPSPLAFYTTGMAISFTTEFQKHAAAAGVKFSNYKLVQDNRYSIQGSAIRGDMIGGAIPVQMAVSLDSDADDDAIQNIIKMAEQTSPAQRYMTEQLSNTFSLNHNGVNIPVANVAPSPTPLSEEPSPAIKNATPLKDGSYGADIISKLDSTKTLFGSEGSAGSSIQATPKRILHIRGTCTIMEDGLKEVKVQVFKQLGSTFRFVGDDSGADRAPSSLAYLAAGVGFCFMTQIGRYAHTVKQELQSYSIIQDTLYQIGADSAKALPVDTHTFLRSGEEDEGAQRNLYMSERTCFLHAAMRESNKSEIEIAP